jgi:2'-5' RNA ligase
MASSASSSTVGNKRVREPTEQEIATNALIDRLFSPDASNVIHKAQTLLKKQAGATSEEHPSSKKARSDISVNTPLLPNGTDVTTALALVFPSAQIDGIRSKYDKAFPRWPNHVNFIFPFIPLSHFDDAFMRLKSALTNSQSFPVKLDTIGHFDQKGQKTYHFNVDSVPMQELFKRVRTALPEVSVKHSEFHPHLTLAQGNGAELEKELNTLAYTLKNTSFQATSLVMLSRTGQQPFRVIHEIPIGPSKVAAAAAPEPFNPFIAAMDASPACSSSVAPSVPNMNNRSVTANGAASLSTTNVPVLDFFYHMARGYSRTDVHRDLAAAWNENPERALQVICHTRDCHTEGKGEKLISYHALLWLRQNKPRTYLANLLTFLRHGYFKDLVNLIDQIDHGMTSNNYDGPENKYGASREKGTGPAASMRGGRRGFAARGRGRGRGASRAVNHSARGGAPRNGRGGGNSRGGLSANTIGGSFEAIAQEKLNHHSSAASSNVNDKKSASGIGTSQLELQLYAEFLRADHLQLKKWRQAKKAYALYKAEEAKKQIAAAATPTPMSATVSNASSTAWFDDDDLEVTDTDITDNASVDDAEWINVTEGVQAVSLQPGATQALAQAAASISNVDTDIDMKDVNKVNNAAVPTSTGPIEPSKTCFISLAAKWAPGENHRFNSQAKRLAKILFGGNQGNGGVYSFIDKAHMQQCMKKYRTLLSTLRAHLCLTERLICSNRWDSINFNSVPSKCHQLLKKAFVKHCGDRYTNYLSGLKRGIGKINVNGLAPHELVKYYLDDSSRAENETVEAAWRALVEKTAESGTFKSAVAIADVSGSMSGLPMCVCIAMTLLISELTIGPYKGRCITFHEEPSWHLITGKTLKQKVACLSKAPWGGSTNFQSSFDLLLNIAKKYKVKQSELPQTLFCFSDMQFNSADPRNNNNNKWETNYDILKVKWNKAGYKLPGIVFWNLNGALCKDTPIRCDTEGCALMSGFSASLLGVFLRTPIIVSPELFNIVGKIDEDVSAEELAAANPLHPITIMMDSIEKYSVIVDPTEA